MWRPPTSTCSIARLTVPGPGRSVACLHARTRATADAREHASEQGEQGEVGGRMSTPVVTQDTPFVPEDDTYHQLSDDPNELETTWWSLNVPERRLGAWLHAGYHANRGTVTWRVFAWDPTGADPGRLAYYKQEPDVPMPAGPDLRDIT